MYRSRTFSQQWSRSDTKARLCTWKNKRRQRKGVDSGAHPTIIIIIISTFINSARVTQCHNGAGSAWLATAVIFRPSDMSLGFAETWTVIAPATAIDNVGPRWSGPQTIYIVGWAPLNYAMVVSPGDSSKYRLSSLVVMILISRRKR